MTAAHRIPVTTIWQLEHLDEAEMLDGYHDGLNNEPCGNNRSTSFWHGWRNGMVDKGHMKIDVDMAVLADEVIKSGYLRKKNG